MKRPKIKCRKCNGVGKVELDPILSGTLHLLKEYKRATAAQFFEESVDGNMTVTAFNKRLERLRALGLVKRERVGKEWKYASV